MHRSHEQEVVLRLRFEEKLNNLHSLNRSFHEIAQRNEERLREKEEEFEIVQGKLDAAQEELFALRASKANLLQWKAHAETEKEFRDEECETLKGILEKQENRLAKIGEQNSGNVIEARNKEQQLEITKEKLDKIIEDIQSQKEIEKRLRKRNDTHVKNISALNVKLTSVSTQVLELQKAHHMVAQKYEKCETQRESLSAEVKAVSLEREAFK